MLIVTKRRYRKQHVIGGSGIFDTVVGFFKNLFKSTAAKKIATNLASSAAKQAGKHLVNKMLETPPPPTITQTSRDSLTRMINDAAPPVEKNINNLMMHGTGRANPLEAVAIQDLVKRMNGRGMKIIK